MDGHNILRNIEDINEYEQVLEEFNRRLLISEKLNGDETYEW